MKPRQREIIEMLHQRSHVADDDPEVYTLLCLTQQEVYLILLGIVLTGVSFSCLEERIVDLEIKALESMKVQKPEWFGDDD